MFLIAQDALVEDELVLGAMEDGKAYSVSERELCCRYDGKNKCSARFWSQCVGSQDRM